MGWDGMGERGCVKYGSQDWSERGEPKRNGRTAKILNSR